MILSKYLCEFSEQDTGQVRKVGRDSNTECSESSTVSHFFFFNLIFIFEILK